MTEGTDEIVALKKKKGWPKGKKRGPRILPTEPQTVRSIQAIESPIYVRVWLKGDTEPIEIKASQRIMETGFHVFLYPSEYDRYRQTRVEFAISEVRRIEITEASPTMSRQGSALAFTATNTTTNPSVSLTNTKPIIHSAKKDAMRRIQEQLEQTGPDRIDEVPGITFGGHDA